MRVSVAHRTNALLMPMAAYTKGRCEVVKVGGGECFFGSLDGVAVMRVDGRREGAKERAVVHSAAATAPTIAVVITPTHHTPSPSSSSQANGYTPFDAMRVYIQDAKPQDEASARRGSYTGQLWAPTAHR
jgi:hypothetical protein